MSNELEKQAAEMVEKRCKNCQDYKTLALCFACENKSKFIPSRAAIEAKLEELRSQTTIKQDSASKVERSGEKGGGDAKEKIVHITKIIHANGEEEETQDIFNVSDFLRLGKLEAEREEMIELLKRLTEWQDDFPAQYVGEIDEICEQAESILKKAEGKVR